MGVFLHFFGHLYLGLGPNQLTHSFGSSFFFETRQKSTSSESLNGFLAYL